MQNSPWMWMFSTPCFARQEIHRQNPPFVPAKPIEIHSSTRVLPCVQPCFTWIPPVFAVFFYVSHHIFGVKNSPAFLTNCCDDVSPFFSQVFPTKIHSFTIFSPCFHHFSTIFPGNPPKNGENSQRFSVVFSPRRKVHDLLGTAALREDGHRPLGVRALARFRARWWWPGGDSYFIWLMMVNSG